MLAFYIVLTVVPGLAALTSGRVLCVVLSHLLGRVLDGAGQAKRSALHQPVNARSPVGSKEQTNNCVKDASNRP
jgi:hypothetical protein